MHSTRGWNWKGDVLVADLEELETMDASEICSKRLNAKEVIFSREKGIYFSNLKVDELKHPEEIRNWEHPPWYGIDQFKERVILTVLENQKGVFHNATTHFRMSVKQLYHFLVHVRKLQIPPSRWTQSQALLAVRGIIPYSTQIHWRILNYSYEFGCQARETQRWLLEYRTYVVRGEINEKTADIQARSSMARALEVNGKARQAEGEAKVV